MIDFPAKSQSCASSIFSSFGALRIKEVFPKQKSGDSADAQVKGINKKLQLMVSP